MGREGFTWLTFPHHTPSLEEVEEPGGRHSAEATEELAYWLVLRLMLSYV